MLVYMEAHLLKIEKMFRKDKFDILLKSSEFKTRLSFSVVIWTLHFSLLYYPYSILTPTSHFRLYLC